MNAMPFVIGTIAVFVIAYRLIDTSLQGMKYGKFPQL